jgi:uncharacterized protein involved in cysteine biosynthesis
MSTILQSSIIMALNFVAPYGLPIDPVAQFFSTIMTMAPEWFRLCFRDHRVGGSLFTVRHTPPGQSRKPPH